MSMRPSFHVPLSAIGPDGAAVAGDVAAGAALPPGAALLSPGAAIVAAAGRWWLGDVYCVAAGAWVAVCCSGLFRVRPGPGCWWYAGTWKGTP